VVEADLVAAAPKKSDKIAGAAIRMSSTMKPLPSSTPFSAQPSNPLPGDGRAGNIGYGPSARSVRPRFFYEDTISTIRALLDGHSERPVDCSQSQ